MAYATNENGARRDQDSPVKSITEAASDKANEIAGKAGEKLEGAMETADAAMRDIADRTGQAGQQMQKVAGNMKTAVDKSLKDQPMTTLAIAAMMGFAIGALWKS